MFYKVINYLNINLLYFLHTMLNNSAILDSKFSVKTSGFFYSFKFKLLYNLSTGAANYK